MKEDQYELKPKTVLRRHLHAHRSHFVRDALVRVLDRLPETIAADQRGGGAVAREDAAEPPRGRGNVARRVGDGALEEGAAVPARSAGAPVAVGSGMRQRRHRPPLSFEMAVTAAAPRACGT